MHTLQNRNTKWKVLNIYCCCCESSAFQCVHFVNGKLKSLKKEMFLMHFSHAVPREKRKQNPHAALTRTHVSVSCVQNAFLNKCTILNSNDIRQNKNERNFSWQEFFLIISKFYSYLNHTCFVTLIFTSHFEKLQRKFHT